MSSGLGLVIRQNKSGGGGVPAGVLIDAQNGLNDTVTANTVELGGVLIRDTDIGGSLFKLGFINMNVGVGINAAAIPTPVKFFATQTIAFGIPQNGTTTILSQAIYTPNAIIPSVNFYALVGSTTLNLANSTVTGANTWNATGIMGSLVLNGNNGTSSVRRLRASMGGISLQGNVLCNDVAVFEARATEQTGGANSITNLYGLYIDQQASTGITNAYGIFQSAIQDVNLFNGTIRATGGVRVDGPLQSVFGGPAVELYVFAGTPIIGAYDRTAANPIGLQISCTGLIVQTSSGIGSFTVNVAGFPMLSIQTGLALLAQVHNTVLPTSTTEGYIASGTYTPTLFNTTNVAASAAFICQWIRTGRVVSVSGSVDIDATAATATILGMSLPIPSTLGVHTALGGTAANGNDNPVQITADTVNNRATFSYAAIDLALRRYSFIFQYLIN